MMHDKRLIDANALIKWFEDVGLGDHSLIESVLAAGVYAGIENAPTIDAVPVVRCRECKKRQDPRECPMCFTEVEEIEGGRMYKFTDLTRSDGFCHMGAKIDGGE